MLDELDYQLLDKKTLENTYGKGPELGMGVITAFGVVAIITVVCYKLFRSKSGNVSLPGGFKFKFTT